MKTRIMIGAAFVALSLCLANVWGTFSQAKSSGESLTTSAQKFLKRLDDKQREQCLLKYDSEKRVDWHFIPKDYRKGLQIKHMSPDQRQLAHALLQSGLSQIGYEKANTIMQLEGVLHELEKAKKGGNIRDTERYYFTIFGEPDESGRWGLSIEGHHLSLNFVVDKNKVVSSTPAFFAANPGEVKASVANTKITKGTRVLAAEETLAFDLVNGLNADQKKKAMIAEKAPREIRAAGAPQPPTDAAQGISLNQLDDEQQQTLKRLVGTYVRCFPRDVASARVQAIREGGEENVHFAWAGSLKPGVGHYYRIQGPSFLIEFVNTQPDAAGNLANHIHCVWRDMKGDFAIPIK